jgi:hypothetical protein
MHACTALQGVNIIAASIQTYGSYNYIAGRRPCRPNARVMFMHPSWALTRDTTVIRLNNESGENIIIACRFDVVQLKWVNI